MIGKVQLMSLSKKKSNSCLVSIFWLCESFFWEIILKLASKRGFKITVYVLKYRKQSLYVNRMYVCWVQCFSVYHSSYWYRILPLRSLKRTVNNNFLRKNSIFIR